MKATVELTTRQAEALLSAVATATTYADPPKGMRKAIANAVNKLADAFELELCEDCGLPVEGGE
jgi:hypothetical protein